MVGGKDFTALNDINLVFKRGEFSGLVGPSGSGKTTLLNIIGTLDSPFEGNAIALGKSVGKLSHKEAARMRNRHYGFIFQTYNLLPVYSVFENVEFPLLLMKRLKKSEIDKRTEKLIEEVGIKEFIKHRPSELSGGQRQRVAVARALVTNPEIVLADEPTANLDSETGGNIIELMKELNKKENTTFVFSTHDPDIIKHASRVVRIKDGLIVDQEA